MKSFNNRVFPELFVQSAQLAKLDKCMERDCITEITLTLKGKEFWGIIVYLWDTGNPVLDFCWCVPRVLKLAWIPSFLCFIICMLWIPQIHLLHIVVTSMAAGSFCPFTFSSMVNPQSYWGSAWSSQMAMAEVPNSISTKDLAAWVF